MIEIAKALAVTAELLGTELSETAIRVMVVDLSAYPVEAVKKALTRCRRELHGRLTLAAILERLETGLPSADEAYAMMVEGWSNDALTVVIPEIANLAAEHAYTLFCQGDKTGARMAFREAYNRLAVGAKPVWSVSAGTDKQQLARAVKRAAELGQIEQPTRYLPAELQPLSPVQCEENRAKVQALLARLNQRKIV